MTNKRPALPFVLGSTLTALLGCAQDLRTGVSALDAGPDLGAPALDTGVREAAPPAPEPDARRPEYPATSALFHVLDALETDGPGGVAIGPQLLYHRGVRASMRIPMLEVQPLWDLAPSRGDSRKCMRIAGMVPGGFAGVLDFSHAYGPGRDFADFSAYAGLAFWARAAEGSGAMTLAAVDRSTYGYGETPEAAAAAGRPWHTRRITLGPDWERHIVLFEDLRQPSSVAESPLRASAVNAFYFVAGMNGERAEVFLDDITLLCRGVCPAP